MTAQPCGCLNNCDDCEAKCHAGVLLRWTGDYDFSGNPHISTFPGYHKRMLEWQDEPTALVWRIRWDAHQLQQAHYWIGVDSGPSEDAQQFLAALVNLGGSFVGTSQSPDVFVGPVRDGQLRGVPNWMSPFVGAMFDPRANVVSNPDASVPGTWVLELGCVRCSKSHFVISWPTQIRLEFDGTGVDIPLADRTIYDFIKKSNPLKLTCQPRTAPEQRSLYWSGNSTDSRFPPACPPDAIMWNDKSDGSYFDPGYGWAIGSSVGQSQPRTLGFTRFAEFSAIVPKLTQHYGFIDDGGPGESLGDTAFQSAKTLWLVPTDLATGTAAGNIQPVLDWLSLGDKRLILDADWEIVNGLNTGDQLLAQDANNIVNVSDSFVAEVRIETSPDNPYDNRGTVSTWHTNTHPPLFPNTYDVDFWRDFSLWEITNFDVALYDLVGYSESSHGAPLIEEWRVTIVGMTNESNDSLAIRATVNELMARGLSYEETRSGMSAFLSLVNTLNPFWDGFLQ